MMTLTSVYRQLPIINTNFSVASVLSLLTPPSRTDMAVDIIGSKRPMTKSISKLDIKKSLTPSSKFQKKDETTNKLIYQSKSLLASSSELALFQNSFLSNLTMSGLHGLNLTRIGKKAALSSVALSQRASLTLPLCQLSPVSYNVSLRHGKDSGYFKDHGNVKDANHCAVKCCQIPECDVAFMLEHRCFTVDCVSQEACQTVALRSSSYWTVFVKVKRFEYDRPENNNWPVDETGHFVNSILFPSLPRKNKDILSTHTTITTAPDSVNISNSQSYHKSWKPQNLNGSVTLQIRYKERVSKVKEINEKFNANVHYLFDDESKPSIYVHELHEKSNKLQNNNPIDVKSRDKKEPNFQKADRAPSYPVYSPTRATIQISGTDTASISNMHYVSERDDNDMTREELETHDNTSIKGIGLSKQLPNMVKSNKIKIIDTAVENDVEKGSLTATDHNDKVKVKDESLNYAVDIDHTAALNSKPFESQHIQTPSVLTRPKPSTVNVASISFHSNSDALSETAVSGDLLSAANDMTLGNKLIVKSARKVILKSASIEKQKKDTVGSQSQLSTHVKFGSIARSMSNFPFHPSVSHSTESRASLVSSTSEIYFINNTMGTKPSLLKQPDIGFRNSIKSKMQEIMINNNLTMTSYKNNYESGNAISFGVHLKEKSNRDHFSSVDEIFATDKKDQKKISQNRIASSQVESGEIRSKPSHITKIKRMNDDIQLRSKKQRMLLKNTFPDRMILNADHRDLTGSNNLVQTTETSRIKNGGLIGVSQSPTEDNINQEIFNKKQMPLPTHSSRIKDFTFDIPYQKNRSYSNPNVEGKVVPNKLMYDFPNFMQRNEGEHLLTTLKSKRPVPAVSSIDDFSDDIDAMNKAEDIISRDPSIHLHDFQFEFLEPKTTISRKLMKDSSSSNVASSAKNSSMPTSRANVIKTTTGNSDKTTKQVRIKENFYFDSEKESSQDVIPSMQPMVVAGSTPPIYDTKQILNSMKTSEGNNLQGSSDTYRVQSHELDTSRTTYSTLHSSKTETSSKDCLIGNTQENVQLKGGRSAGRFFDMGILERIQECAMLCCRFEECNLALVVDRRCFLVACHNVTLCKTVPIKVGEINSMVIRIVKDENPGTIRTVLNNKNSSITDRFAPRTEFAKQIYSGITNEDQSKDLSNSENYISSSRKQIDNKLFPNFYERNNIHNELNIPVANESPKLYSHNQQIFTHNAHEYGCIHREFRKGFVFVKGMEAGSFRRQEFSGDDSDCLRLCCEDNTCDAVFMIRNLCYTVACHDPTSSCDIRPINDEVNLPRLILMESFDDFHVDRKKSQIPIPMMTHPNKDPLGIFFKAARLRINLDELPAGMSVSDQDLDNEHENILQERKALASKPIRDEHRLLTRSKTQRLADLRSLQNRMEDIESQIEALDQTIDEPNQTDFEIESPSVHDLPKSDVPRKGYIHVLQKPQRMMQSEQVDIISPYQLKKNYGYDIGAVNPQYDNWSPDINEKKPVSEYESNIDSIPTKQTLLAPNERHDIDNVRDDFYKNKNVHILHADFDNSNGESQNRAHRGKISDYISGPKATNFVDEVLDESTSQQTSDDEYDNFDHNNLSNEQKYSSRGAKHELYKESLMTQNIPKQFDVDMPKESMLPTIMLKNDINPRLYSFMPDMTNSKEHPVKGKSIYDSVANHQNTQTTTKFTENMIKSVEKGKDGNGRDQEKTYDFLHHSFNDADYSTRPYHSSAGTAKSYQHKHASGSNDIDYREMVGNEVYDHFEFPKSIEDQDFHYNIGSETGDSISNTRPDTEYDGDPQINQNNFYVIKHKDIRNPILLERSGKTKSPLTDHTAWYKDKDKSNKALFDEVYEPLREKGTQKGLFKPMPIAMNSILHTPKNKNIDFDARSNAKSDFRRENNNERSDLDTNTQTSRPKKHPDLEGPNYEEENIPKLISYDDNLTNEMKKKDIYGEYQEELSEPTPMLIKIIPENHPMIGKDLMVYANSKGSEGYTLTPRPTTGKHVVRLEEIKKPFLYKDGHFFLIPTNKGEVSIKRNRDKAENGVTRSIILPTHDDFTEDDHLVVLKPPKRKVDTPLKKPVYILPKAEYDKMMWEYETRSLANNIEEKNNVPDTNHGEPYTIAGNVLSKYGLSTRNTVNHRSSLPDFLGQRNNQYEVVALPKSLKETIPGVDESDRDTSTYVLIDHSLSDVHSGQREALDDSVVDVFHDLKEPRKHEGVKESRTTLMNDLKKLESSSVLENVLANDFKEVAHAIKEGIGNSSTKKSKDGKQIVLNINVENYPHLQPARKHKPTGRPLTTVSIQRQMNGPEPTKLHENALDQINFGYGTKKHTQSIIKSHKRVSGKHPIHTTARPQMRKQATLQSISRSKGGLSLLNDMIPTSSSLRKKNDLDDKSYREDLGKFLKVILLSRLYSRTSISRSSFQKRTLWLAFEIKLRVPHFC